MPPDNNNVIPMKGANEQRPAEPSQGADARPEGGGGGGKPPKEKRIDWGRYTALLDSFALIYSTDTVWDANSRLIMKISAMAHAHGADYVRMWKAAEASERRFEGRRWTVLPDHVVFDPTETVDAETHVNLFGGLQMQPQEGDVEPMLQLVRYLTSRASDSADECDQVMHWLMCWMAYPLQKVGTKLRTAVVMHGDEGAGKNFLFDTLVMIYGQYGTTVGQDELEDKFNDWRSGKLLVVGDEVSSRAELVHNKNRLKALITSPTVQINPKNLPRREEKNHMNIVFLSNELQPLALDNTDRRYLVVYTPPAREREFYAELGRWRANGGVQAWYHYLLNYPIADFDPFSPAPITEAKRALIDLNRKTPERFWIEWASGELDLPYAACSIDQMYRAYSKYAQRVGDRFPLQKQVCSSMVQRISGTLGPTLSPPREAVRVKPMKAHGKATRMLLVAPPSMKAEGDDGPGLTEAEWATQAVDAFELHLREYIHGSHSHDQGEHGDGSSR